MNRPRLVRLSTFHVAKKLTETAGCNDPIPAEIHPAVIKALGCERVTIQVPRQKPLGAKSGARVHDLIPRNLCPTTFRWSSDFRKFRSAEHAGEVTGPPWRGAAIRWRRRDHRIRTFRYEAPR